MKTTFIQLTIIRLLRVGLLLLIFCNFMIGCNNKGPATITTAQTDSTAYKDSVASYNDSMYSLTLVHQISIYGATIDGADFYNACQHIDFLFFVYPEGTNYSILSASISPGAITSVSLTPNVSPLTIPLSPSPHSFTIRPENISIIDLNNFFSGLLAEGVDLKNHGSNYLVNIKPDTVIQQDALGYYFDIIISASIKASPYTEAATKGKVHPCPPCY